MEAAGDELGAFAGVLPAFPHSLTSPGMANAWQKSSASALKKAGSRQDTKGGLAG
jgi:hypothetical protein